MGDQEGLAMGTKRTTLPDARTHWMVYYEFSLGPSSGF